jgi:hypothetical protein
MSARAPMTRPQRLAVAGWLVTVVFAGLVAVGADEPVTGAVLATIALAMAAWVLLRGSRPAFWVSAVLGALHTLEQAGYLASDVADGHAGTAASDALGLAGGLLVLVGSVAGLRAARHGSEIPADHETVPSS